MRIYFSKSRKNFNLVPNQLVFIFPTVLFSRKRIRKSSFCSESQDMYWDKLKRTEGKAEVRRFSFEGTSSPLDRLYNSSNFLRDFGDRRETTREVRFRFRVHIFGVSRQTVSPYVRAQVRCASLSASVFRAMNRG